MRVGQNPQASCGLFHLIKRHPWRVGLFHKYQSIVT
jgi:hypothetical protein